jgi:hypothetical protein
MAQWGVRASHPALWIDLSSGNSNCPDACTLVLSSSHRVASDTSFPENQAGG